MRIPFTQIDAFADAAFTGNPAAVMPLAAWLPDATLQAIAAENNLAETAFIIVSDAPAVADFELRWFTPAVEVALCGHATLASGHLVLASAPAMQQVRFRTRKAGVLTVARAGDGLEMALPAWPARTPCPAPLAAKITAAFGAVPAEIWLRGEDYILAVYEHASEVRALTPDFRALAALQNGDVLAIATALGVGDPSGANVVSRAFAPGAGIDEDFVTGSAHSVLAPYWAERIGRDSFTAYQASRRGGQLSCRVTPDQIFLTGRARTVIEGEFILA